MDMDVVYDDKNMMKPIDGIQETDLSKKYVN